MNEKDYAEALISTGIIGNNPYKALSVLAKYYYSECGHKKEKVEDMLNTFMIKNYKGYNTVKWSKIIERICQKSCASPLLCIQSVRITENEMRTIKDLKKKKLERLAFTLLCLAKYANLVNPKNNNWVNKSIPDIFKLSYIRAARYDRPKMLHILKELGLIGFSKIVDNTNINVHFMDDKSTPILHINDFRTLGLEYENFFSKDYMRCKNCGLLIKRVSNNQVYCSNCALLNKKMMSAQRKRQQRYKSKNVTLLK